MTDHSLLCTETNNLCFDDLEARDDQTREIDCENVVGNESEALICAVPLQRDEILCLLFERQGEFLPRGDFLHRLRSGELDLCVRKEALDWIYKVSVLSFFPLIWRIFLCIQCGDLFFLDFIEF